ncbi:MAG TPA: 5'-nucleotidase, lipoprotein e(P4) family [Vicinamibacterales bacterium]
MKALRVQLLGLALLSIVLDGCRTASSPRPSNPAAPGRQTNENLNAVLWMQTAAEYRASTLQAYRLATMQLDAAVRDRRWTAAVEQTADASALPPALVVDLDETILDNSAFEARQMRDGQAFSEEVWNRWCEERSALAVPGAVPFLQYAQSHGVTPIYITNRDHNVEEATRDVLLKLGAPIDTTRDTVLTRHENGWDASDKSARRRFVAERYRILLLVGDNFEDFVPGTQASVDDRAALLQKYADYWGTKWIVLPNPTYGSWESAITFGQGRLTDAQELTAKYKALRF